MHDKGILVFLCFVAGGILAILGDQTKNLDKMYWFLTIVCGLVATLLMLWYFIDASGSYAGSFLSFGFYLSAIAAIGMLLATYLYKTPGDSIKSGFDSLKNNIEQKTKNENHGNRPI